MTTTLANAHDARKMREENRQMIHENRNIADNDRIIRIQQDENTISSLKVNNAMMGAFLGTWIGYTFGAMIGRALTENVFREDRNALIGGSVGMTIGGVGGGKIAHSLSQKKKRNQCKQSKAQRKKPRSVSRRFK